MNRKMATLLRFGPVVALLAIMAGVFALLPVGPAGAVTNGATVTLTGTTTAGTVGIYTIAFKSAAAFATGDTVTITFPGGTTIGTAAAIFATAPTIEGVAVAAVTDISRDDSLKTVTLTAPAITTVAIGSDIDVVITVGITNTDTAASDHVLTIVTSKDSAVGTSDTYSVGTTRLTINPAKANTLTEMQFTFVTTSASLTANTGEIRLTMDKDTQIPATISKSNVLIQSTLLTNTGGANTVGANQVVPLAVDPTFDVLASDTRRKIIILKVPDMDLGTTAGAGQGVQGIGAGATVKVTFTTAAGILNAKAREDTTVAISAKDPGGTEAITAALGLKVKVNLPSTLTLNAVDGSRGKVVVATGLGYASGFTATLFREVDTADGRQQLGTEPTLGEAVVGSDGTFAISFTMGGNLLAGNVNNFINATDGKGSAATIPTLKLRGSVEVTPASASRGDTLAVKLTDFAASTAVSEFSIGGVAATLAATTTGTDGTLNTTTTLPASAGTGVKEVKVSVGSDTGRTTSITVKAAPVTVSPASVAPNQSVTMSGSGFTTGTATINNTTGVTIGGTAIDLPGTANVTVDNGGNWVTTFVLPVSATTLLAGTYDVKVTDSGGAVGEGKVTIPARKLTISPSSSRQRSTITLSGTGFPANNSASGSDNRTVTVTYGTTTATATPDSSGGFSTTMTVPTTATIPSDNNVTATISGAPSATSSATHSVPAASLTVSPASGPPGTVVQVTGANYPNFASVSAMTLGARNVIPSPAPDTDREGTFTGRILAPDLDIGTYSVDVTVGGTTIASTSFAVTAAPVAPPPPAIVASVAPAAALAPLGANLVRVWGFDAPTQKFQLHDPAAALLSDLSALKRGGGYWINVKSAQKVTLGTFEYDLSAGWNNVGWQG